MQRNSERYFPDRIKWKGIEGMSEEFKFGSSISVFTDQFNLKPSRKPCTNSLDLISRKAIVKSKKSNNAALRRFFRILFLSIISLLLNVCYYKKHA